MSPASSTSTRRVACGSKESGAAPEPCAPPSGRSWTRPTAKSPRSGSARGGPRGGAGGGASGGGRAPAAATSACGRAPAGAFEVEIVIPDFSVDGAGPLGAGGAHEAQDDGLGLRASRELEGRLLPVVRPRRRRRGLPERGRFRGRVRDDRKERGGALQLVGADEVGQAVARRRLDGDRLPEVAKVDLPRRAEEEPQAAAAP